MIKLRNITIVKDKRSCADCQCNCTIANDEFPELIPEVQDECSHFVVDSENRYFWHDSVFFAMNNITTFEVKDADIIPGAPIRR